MTVSSIILSTLAAEEDVDEEKVPLIGAQQGLVLIEENTLARCSTIQEFFLVVPT